MVWIEAFPNMAIIRVKLSSYRGTQGVADTSAKRGKRGEADGSVYRGWGMLGMRAAAKLMGIILPQWGSPQRMWSGQAVYPASYVTARPVFVLCAQYYKCGRL